MILLFFSLDANLLEDRTGDINISYVLGKNEICRRSWGPGCDLGGVWTAPARCVARTWGRMVAACFSPTVVTLKLTFSPDRPGQDEILMENR